MSQTEENPFAPAETREPAAGEEESSYLDKYLAEEEAEKAQDDAPKKEEAADAPESNSDENQDSAKESPRDRDAEANDQDDPNKPSNEAGDSVVPIPGPEGGIQEPAEQVVGVRPEGGQSRVMLDLTLIGHQYAFDAPDPQFYLGAALLIGLASLFLFLFGFVTRYSRMADDAIVALITLGAGILCFLIPFFYYLCTSKHYAAWGKLWDGFAGAVPFLVLGVGLGFIYALIGRALYFVFVDGTTEDLFLCPATVIAYGLVYLPVFFFTMKLQANSAEAWRERNNIPQVDMTRTRFVTSGFLYMAVMVRRVVVGWVVGTCVSAHMCMPVYALAWCAFELYKLAEKEGIWIVFVILLPFIIIIVVLAIIPFTRIIPKALLKIVIMYFYYPLMDWDPREGTSWVMYDNSLTYERMCIVHNRKIEAAENYFVSRETQQMEAYYEAAKLDRDFLEGEQVALLDME